MGITPPKITSAVWNNLQCRFRYGFPLPENMKLLHLWKFYDRPPHAGQVLTVKTLPNGNIQKRITTAYGSEVLGLETGVYSPKGELLKAYAGIRDCDSSTWCYASGIKEAKTLINKVYSNQPDAKRLLH